MWQCFPIWPWRAFKYLDSVFPFLCKGLIINLHIMIFCVFLVPFTLSFKGSFFQCSWDFSRIMVGGTNNMPWNHRREADVCLYPFITLALKGSGWSTARPGCYTPGHRPSTQWTRSWVGRGLLWKGKENLSTTGVQNLDWLSRDTDYTNPATFQECNPVNGEGLLCY